MSNQSDEPFDFFAELDLLAGELEPREHNPREIIRAPFCWPGGKMKTQHMIHPHLPLRKAYGEPFGGAMSVMLGRKPSKLEVYNDRYGGVTDFYRCLQNQENKEKLKERLYYTIHSREEFYFCAETWENVEDLVERAARWFYSVRYSFGGKGKTFGRAVGIQNPLSGSVSTAIDGFDEVHKRILKVQIENRDFRDIMKDFDHHEMVWYCDPPYFGATSTHYKHEFTVKDHRDLLELIHTRKGFVALSGYPNSIYNEYPWDNVITWKQFCSAEGAVHNEHNNLADRAGRSERKEVTECLYIKEAQ